MSSVGQASPSLLDRALQTGSRLFFKGWRGAFDGLGWTDAADNLDRYLGGTGAEKVYSEKQIEEMEPITYRIGRNLSQIEAKTLTGRSGNSVVNKKLLSLRPGQTTEIEDYWGASYSPKKILSNAVDSIGDVLHGGDGSRLRRAYDDLTDTVAQPCYLRGNRQLPAEIDPTARGAARRRQALHQGHRRSQPQRPIRLRSGPAW